MQRNFLAASLIFIAGSTFVRAQEAPLRINQIQVIGTHNSYHAGIAPSETKLWAEKNPKLLAALDYRHPVLTTQLDAGVRQLELDVYADPTGGLYSHPYGPKLVAQAGLPADPDFDPQHLMDRPGFKVMHVQDVDYRSNCQPFVACLAEVRAWSQAHPGHLPLYLLIETKQEPLKVSFPATQPVPFTPGLFDALDSEIRSVFAPDEMITPDQVRGSYLTLDEAARADNWPTLASARGKVIFLMDQRKMGPMYLAGHTSLKGRILFTNAVPGEPDAAFTEQNDSPADVIAAIVKQGYLVRTRADENTLQARTNDTARRDAVMASGAQILSTDYPSSEPAPSGYSVSFPGKVIARCDPVNASAGCENSKLVEASSSNR